MPTSDEPTQESLDDLSFEKAEFEEGQDEFTCAFCNEELQGFFFQVNEARSCEQCRYEVEKLRTGGSSSGRLLRAAAAGLVAAVLGALLYYAVLSITGYEIGLIAIVVGFMVGWAVRWGAQHRGGWGYQALAVGLTYVAIVSTYVPLMFQAAEEMEVESAAQAEEADALIAQATASDAELVETAAVAEEPLEYASAAELAAEADPDFVEEVAFGELSFAEKAVSLAFVLGLLLALPFLGGFENIIGLLIIFFALAQAWSLNKKLKLEIEGPFEVGRRPPPVGAPSSGQ